MKLDEFIRQLQKLSEEGHGNLQVFCRHGSSGDCGELSHAYVTDETDECGPFDLKGQNYISIYAGTPETDPDHPVVGRRFRAYCIRDQRTAIYYCDSYDPAIGYWMTREDCPDDRKQDQYGKWRRNVSERAIDRTFHTIRR